ncbi:MAG: SIS domain-containing protein [Candidatus Hermodarchaeota archaeon]|nr:SIS domain-containing protein [Candidatus Hermodarchaeota archaeon]
MTSTAGSNKDGTFLRAMQLITDNIQKNIEFLRTEAETVTKFVDIIEKTARDGHCIFVVGSGRSAMVGQMFQTRLEHLNVPVYFITNSRSVPHLHKGDLLLVISGSGRTAIVKAIIENYLDQNPQIISITSYPESWIGRMSDLAVKLIGRTKIDVARREKGEEASLTPEGTQFEIASAVFLDGVIAELVQRFNKTNEDLLAEHSQAT